jgi:hypothetical protein
MSHAGHPSRIPLPPRTRRPWLAGIVGSRASAWLGGIALGVLLAVVGLARADRLTPARPEALVVLAQWLDATHARADLQLARGEVAAALTGLHAARTGPWPRRAEAGDDAVVLRHDLLARLLRLRLDHPELAAEGVPTVDDPAWLALVDDALAGDGAAVTTNPFTARLVALRGEWLQRGGRDDEALGAYELALEMNRVLLEALLAEPAGDTGDEPTTAAGDGVGVAPEEANP